jgi:lipase maturation factor 1
MKPRIERLFNWLSRSNVIRLYWFVALMSFIYVMVSLGILSELWAWFYESSATTHYTISSLLLERGMGLIMLVAGLSMYIQYPGLIGSKGIMPAQAAIDTFLQRRALAWMRSEHSRDADKALATDLERCVAAINHDSENDENDDDDEKNDVNRLNRLAHRVFERNLMATALEMPTVLLVDAGDAMIGSCLAVCSLCGALVMFGVADWLAVLLLPDACAVLVVAFVPPLLLAVCFALYLSVRQVGSVFLQLQFDTFLLESCALVASLSLVTRGTASFAPDTEMATTSLATRLVLVAVRFVLFKITFSSGVVKLTSGDANWRNSSAMTYHYLSQPVPNPLSYYMHHAPLWLHQVSLWAHFFVELALPFVFFAPPSCDALKSFVALALLGFQATISATGNYGFFGVNNAMLGVALVGDSQWPRWLRYAVGAPLAVGAGASMPSLSIVYSGAMALVGAQVLTRVLALGAVALYLTKKRAYTTPGHLQAIFERFGGARLVETFDRAYRWHVCGSYGLFSIMTIGRTEIVVEGSNDQRSWHRYEFGFKCSSPERRPPFMFGHLARLEWRIWFSQFGKPEHWVTQFFARVLQGERAVLALLERVPDEFRDAPPRYLRTVVYQYDFTPPGSAHWWSDKRVRDYLPVIQLADDRKTLIRAPIEHTDSFDDY